jgi:hypothetical protein
MDNGNVNFDPSVINTERLRMVYERLRDERRENSYVHSDHSCVVLTDSTLPLRLSIYPIEHDTTYILAISISGSLLEFEKAASHAREQHDAVHQHGGRKRSNPNREDQGRSRQHRKH